LISDKLVSETENGQNRTPFFSIKLPINYEDTDAGGVVYYGNYLAYMERARNACFRELGYPLHVLVEQYSILFVVTDARLKYLVPAKLDDLLEVMLRIKSYRGASIVFEHLVYRHETRLVEAEIQLAAVNSGSFKPRRIPDFLKAGFSRWYMGGINFAQEH